MVCSYKRQAGMSLLMWLVTLGVAGFFLLCAFRIIPTYVDDRYLKSALRNLGQSETNVDDMTDDEIRKKLGNFFMVNNIRNFSTKDVKIERLQGHTLIRLEYEKRVPILYNIDAVMSFHNVLDSSNPGACCDPFAK